VLAGQTFSLTDPRISNEFCTFGGSRRAALLGRSRRSLSDS
jgi:hypothetical protein